MTQSWTDIGNATLVIAMGANPAENHPACMAHVNRARRAPGYTRTDNLGHDVVCNKPAAKLIVIDPRKTRTALQADEYVRVRPGTDIAFFNGVIRHILVDLLPADAVKMKAFRKFHGMLKDGRKFCKDGADGSGSVVTLPAAPTATGNMWPRYSDASFKLNANPAAPTAADYKRSQRTFPGVAATTFADMPEYDIVNIDGVDYADIEAAGTVYDTLLDHVAPYTLGLTAEICDCSIADIQLVAGYLVKHSARFGGDAGVALEEKNPNSTNHRATTVLYAMGLTQHTCGASNVKALAELQILLGNMGWAGGGINALRGIHNVQGSTDMGLLYGNIPAYSGNPGTTSSFGSYMDGLFGNKLGSSKTAATLTLGNLTFTARYPGKGGNYLTVRFVNPGAASQPLKVSSASRLEPVDKIYTDYTFTLATNASGVVTTTEADIVALVSANGNAANILLKAATTAGATVVAPVGRTDLTGGAHTFTKAYQFAQNGLQQKGYFSMLKAWFSDTSYRGVANNEGNGTTTGCVASAIPELTAEVGAETWNVDQLFSVWPKGNGHNHIKMFREMAEGNTKAAVVWGQNPAVTEPAQSRVREGLKNLDLLVVTDIFETETAACDRKAGAFTYLIPACSHVEEAGSVTNSGRVLQWRYQCADPRGNTKTDLELLLRFAYALEQADAFDHIKTMWGTLKKADGTALGLGWTDAYAKLYGGQYGWTPGDPSFSSENVAKAVYKQMCAPQNTGGTIWIYLEAWNDGTLANAATTKDMFGNDASRGYVVSGSSPNRTDNVFGSYGALLFDLPTQGIRAKSRSRADNGNLLFANWGYSWLVNRRVLYQDGNVVGDQADTFQSPELIARIFVSTNTQIIEYGQSYRTVHRMADKPLNSGGTVPSVHVLPGRFSAHTEPYETPLDDWETWGKNSTTDLTINASGFENLVYKAASGYSETEIGTKADFPLVLTTIRCVEHFQGGPITRNNWWNVAAEPEPWIEINSYDARNASPPINDGDLVKIVTARTEGFANDEIESTYPRALYGEGFRARVGVGAQTNQRVGQGVVAIPWHWGDRGLSTGSRANDLTIDAMDANTTIPEYKACLCRIEKI